VCKVKPATPATGEEPECWNGVLETGEECEKGISCEKGTCEESTCKCTGVVMEEKPVCGNEKVESGEECEKDADCKEGFVCSECACKAKPAQEEICGNGKLDASEECDIGTAAISPKVLTMCGIMIPKTST